MFRRFSANFALLSVFLDALFIIGGLYFADSVRGQFNGLAFVMAVDASVRIPNELYLIFPLIWVGVLVLFSVYDGRRNFRVGDEFTSLTSAAALSSIAMAGVLYLTYRSVSRFLFLTFVVSGYALMVVWRAVYRYMWSQSNLLKTQSRRVLILGGGYVGKRFGDQIQSTHPSGLLLVGFLDENEVQSDHSNIIGSLNDVRTVIGDYRIDDVVVALPGTEYQRVNQILNELYDMPVRVWVIPDYFSMTLHKASVEEFAGIPMLDLRAPALSEYQRMIKRAFDLALTATSLLAVLPLMGIIGLLVLIWDGRPILFKQKRVGESGKLFDMFKFRTMVVNADQQNNQVYPNGENGESVFVKDPYDPRITRLGRILRRTSLDELPQFFNVLRGEMSLVGPRPELPHLVEKYESWQRTRFVIPQGMTGWWQVNGRSDKPMQFHTEEDLYYIKNYSIWLDVYILIKTFWVVLRGKGSY
jgi:exopolysaccharide biosynthesis polyprenyl glycosylphosphotransferase